MPVTEHFLPFLFLKCKYSSLLTVYWWLIEQVQIFFSKKSTDNGKYMKVVYYKVSTCFWEKVQLINPFSYGKGRLDMWDMLKYFRVLTQFFFFCKISQVTALFIYNGKAIKLQSNADLDYISKKFFSCITSACSPNTCSSTTRRIFLLVQLHLSWDFW